MSRRALAVTRVLRLWVGLIGFWCGVAAWGAAGPQQVLVLNSYHWGYGWTDAQVGAITDVLRAAPVPPVVVVQDLDVLRQPKAIDQPAQLDFLRTRLGSGRPQVVITTDDPALQFAIRYRAELFPDAAIVFSDARDVDSTRWPADLPITGVRERVDVVGSLAAVQALIPDARRVVVFGNFGSAQTGFAHAHEALLRMPSPLAVEQHFDLRLDEILKVVAPLGKSDIVVSLATAMDEHGRRNDYGEVISRISAASAAPVVDITAQRVRAGVSLGGRVADGAAEGRRAAELALRILAGAPARHIPVEQIEPVLMFSHPQMQRLGLSEQRLPPEAQVVGRPTDPTDHPTVLLWVAGLALLALVVTIGALVREVRHRSRVDDELKCSEEHLRLAVEGATDGIWDWNLVSGEIYVSPRYATMLGFAPGELAITVDSWPTLVHPDDLPMIRARYQTFRDSPRSTLHMEFRMRTKSGSWRWIMARGAVGAWGAEGQPSRIAGSHTDITDAKEASERLNAALHQKEVLLKEIYHRVKNNLQVVSSLLTMQGRSVEDASVRALFDDSAARVMAMSEVHEQLYRSQDLASIDFKRYLSQLLDRLASQHGRHGVRIESMLDDVKLGIETAIPCALIVNELVANAVKHAFAGDAGGRVQVGLRAEFDGGAQLWVEDDGIGLPPGFAPAGSRGLGWRLVMGLTNQIGGKLEVKGGSLGVGGTRVLIRFRPQSSESRRYADVLKV